MRKMKNANAQKLKEIDYALRRLKGYYFDRGNEPMMELLAGAHDRIFMARLVHRCDTHLKKKTIQVKSVPTKKGNLIMPRLFWHNKGPGRKHG